MKNYFTSHLTIRVNINHLIIINHSNLWFRYLIHIDGQDGKDMCFASQKLNHVNHVNPV